MRPRGVELLFQPVAYLFLWTTRVGYDGVAFVVNCEGLQIRLGNRLCSTILGIPREKDAQ